MAAKSDPDPQGEMKRVDYFHESSSGCYDESRVATLSPGKGSHIEMEIFTASGNRSAQQRKRR
jgi:hypothetical protein